MVLAIDHFSYLYEFNYTGLNKLIRYSIYDQCKCFARAPPIIPLSHWHHPNFSCGDVTRFGIDRKVYPIANRREWRNTFDFFSHYRIQGPPLEFVQHRLFPGMNVRYPYVPHPCVRTVRRMLFGLDSKIFLFQSCEKKIALQDSV